MSIPIHHPFQGLRVISIAADSRSWHRVEPHLDEEGHLRNPMSTNAKSSSSKDDLEWSEVGQLGLRYARIPLALLFVEAFYWFLTQPSDTLAPLQVTEAWLCRAQARLFSVRYTHRISPSTRSGLLR